MKKLLQSKNSLLSSYFFLQGIVAFFYFVSAYWKWTRWERFRSPHFFESTVIIWSPVENLLILMFFYPTIHFSWATCCCIPDLILRCCICYASFIPCLIFYLEIGHFQDYNIFCDSAVLLRRMGLPLDIHCTDKHLILSGCDITAIFLPNPPKLYGMTFLANCCFFQAEHR